MQNTLEVHEAASTTLDNSESSAHVPVSGTGGSADGTIIVYDRIGHGAPVILVDGALCHRTMGYSAQLAAELAPHFTVITYDRRGRGESGDTTLYSVQREVEDIAALLDEVGGSAYLWGTSSGGLLALEAASRLRGVKKVALYEAPFFVGGDQSAVTAQWDEIDTAIAEHRRGDAVKLFLRAVGVPGGVIAVMRVLPVWSKLKAIADTLPYDGALTRSAQAGSPSTTWASVMVPTLVMDGGKSPQRMRDGNRALALALPNAQHKTLAGQAHVLKPKAHAPALVEFFNNFE